VSPIETIMRSAPVIPVLVIEDAAHAAPIAAALVAGGLPVLEVTLRTASALDVIREMKQVPGAIVGAGTVLNEYALEDALAAGSEFIVSPGFTDGLAKAAIASGTAFLPGIATSSDIMRGLDLGLDRFKFFPAEANGGIPALKAISAPFGAVKFCPTGGITAADRARLAGARSCTLLRRFLAGPKGLARSGGDRSGGAGCCCAGAMTLLAELDARLQALHPRTAETPLFNPVFQLSLELSRRIESGDLSLDDLGNLVAELECEGLLARAHRLQHLLAPLAQGENHARLAARAAAPDFASFAARWRQPVAHVVFTAHPTFLLTERQTEAVAQAAGSGEIGASTTCVAPHDRDAITLDNEHRAAMDAMGRAQDARDAMVRTLLGQARQKAGRISGAPSPRCRCALPPGSAMTWTGAPTSWATSLRYRLRGKGRAAGSLCRCAG
jgi:2-dehydro-3-deoxyphosphogluconate aldolase/(4S)-4-hydroxy-2-oxoglutarate aldolase